MCKEATYSIKVLRLAFKIALLSVLVGNLDALYSMI